MKVIINQYNLLIKLFDIFALNSRNKAAKDKKGNHASC
jgi:hypothetical protein